MSAKVPEKSVFCFKVFVFQCVVVVWFLRLMGSWRVKIWQSSCKCCMPKRVLCRRKNPRLNGWQGRSKWLLWWGH